jgi:MFS family permease
MRSERMSAFGGLRWGLVIAIGSFLLLITVVLRVSYLVNLVFSSTEDWRAMFWVAVIAAAALALDVLRVPESPAWQIRNGRTDEARPDRSQEPKAPIR